MPENKTGDILYATAIKDSDPLTVVGFPNEIRSTGHTKFQTQLEKLSYTGKVLVFVEIRPGESYVFDQTVGM